MQISHLLIQYLLLTFSKRPAITPLGRLFHYDVTIKWCHNQMSTWRSTYRQVHWDLPSCWYCKSAQQYDTGKFSTWRSTYPEIYTWILCLSYLHEKQTSRIQSLYLYFMKISRFGYEISVFKYTTGRYSEQPPEQPAHTSRMSLHGKMDVKIFLLFIVAENTGSVNIEIYITCIVISTL